jgi:class 3 adenylate cyclase/pSer/pThr/pTyr-binding forkhead associated (FHA) protein
MWSMTITSPKSKPLQLKLTSGKMMIGRIVTSDIVINDNAASRRHAEIYYDDMTELLGINDLKSSNGTFVNRQRISGFYRLHDGDIIRIGQTEMHLARISDVVSIQKDVTGTSLLTRGMVLEAIDEHPIPLNEITEELNTVVDADSAIRLVTEMVKRTMGVDNCEIILAADFKKINMENPDNLMVRTIRNCSIETSPLALCVPVIGGGKPYALIYMERTRPEARPFEKGEIQLAVGISHQTVLAMQRIELLQKIRKEGQTKQLLMRFVSPIESDDLLKDYLKTGSLPELSEKTVTVLFAEIADSTGLAERIGPAKFLVYLNAFYQFATQTVFKSSGVAKYLGDGLLAVFMEAKDQPCPEERAAVVACEIVDFVRKADSPEPDRPAVVGIAINTGKAMVGYVGAQDRAEFNVLGNLIKITSRMQDYALPNSILVGLATAHAIQTKYMLEKAGSLSIKGSEQPIQAYTLSLMKTAPFVPPDKNSDMPAAFKAIAEKFKSLTK